MTSPPSTQPLLPLEIVAGIAEFQDHQSLTALGATCTSLHQFVCNADSLWKTLHDQRWRHGKRNRFKGPPSRRPRGGVVFVDDEGIISWREEFIRRHLLDKGLPERIARLQAMGNGRESPFEGLIQDGADIFDSIKLLCKNLGYPGEVVALLSCINAGEAQDDWEMLQSIHEVGYEDGLMVISKLMQPMNVLLGRSSPDDIYDEINGELDELCIKDLESFDVVEELFGGGDMDTILLHKALASKRVDQLVLSLVIAPRVLSRIHFSRTPLEVLDDLRGYIVSSMAKSNNYQSMAVYLSHMLE